MSFGGAVSAMITSLKNNKRTRVSAFEKTKGYGNDSNIKLHFNKEASQKQLLEIKKTFIEEQEKFIADYEGLVEMEMVLQPERAPYIQAIAPKLEKIEKSFRFSIGAPQALGIHSGVGHEIQQKLADAGEAASIAESLEGSLVESFCNDIKHFWQYSLRNIRKAIENSTYKEHFTNPLNCRSGVRGEYIEILKNLRGKIQDLELLNPEFSAVGEQMDEVVALLPDGYHTKPELLKDFDVAKKINRLAELLMDEGYVNSILRNLPLDTSLSLTEELEKEILKAENTVEKQEEFDIEGVFTSTSQSKENVTSETQQVDTEVYTSVVEPSAVDIQTIPVEASSFDEAEVVIEPEKEAVIAQPSAVDTNAEEPKLAPLQMVQEVDINSLFQF